MELSELKNKKEFWYFVGYFWADGYINHNKYCQMAILESDCIELLNIIDGLFKYTHRTRIRINRREQGILYINNKDLLDLFVSNGKYSNTIESHTNILKIIPNEYHIYFLRGLIDGDGCYCEVYDKRSNTTSIQFHISGRYEQDWEGLQNELKQFGIHTSLRQSIHGKYKHSIIICTDTDELIKFYDVIYGNKDGVYLTRKVDKFSKMIIKHKKLKDENLAKRGYYEITIGDNPTDRTYNLKKYCEKHNLCYENCSKLSTGYIKKYKNINIVHKKGLIPNN